SGRPFPTRGWAGPRLERARSPRAQGQRRRRQSRCTERSCEIDLRAPGPPGEGHHQGGGADDANEDGLDQQADEEDGDPTGQEERQIGRVGEVERALWSGVEPRGLGRLVLLGPLGPEALGGLVAARGRRRQRTLVPERMATGHDWYRREVVLGWRR